MLYLDHNATSPLLPEARAAMLDALDRLWANPSSPHAAGQAAAAALEQARRELAAAVGRRPREVVFTSGATEANALALGGTATSERPEIWVSAVEHPSALAWGTRRLPVDGAGRLDLDALDRALAERGARVAVLSLMAANNETGVIQPVDEAYARCQRHGVALHCDATQALGRVPLPVGWDLLSLSAHKLGGPRGVGALVSRLPVDPILRGGPQERGRRPGTPNLPGILGFTAAIRSVLARGPWDPGPRDRLQAACEALGGRVLGAGAPRLPNTLSVLFPWPGELVVAALDLEGVACSTGSACASGAAEPSHVLRAMGLTGVPVRFSLGPDSDVDPVIAALARVAPRLEAACASSSR